MRDRNDAVDGLHEPHELEVMLDRPAAGAVSDRPAPGGKSDRLLDQPEDPCDRHGRPTHDYHDVLKKRASLQ